MNNNNNNNVTNDGDDDIEMDEESLALNTTNYNTTNSNDAIATTTTTPALKKNTSTVAFFRIYFKTQGGPEIIVLIFLLSVGIGAITSTVPGIMGNQYAQLRYGYNPHGEDGEVSCNDWDASTASNTTHTNTTQLPPAACRQGGNDAQSMAANTAFVKNVCVLVFSSSVGRYSDCYGRKVVLTLGYVLMALTPLTVWLIQVVPTTPPSSCE